MSNHTLTFSEAAKGFPSFYSYIPEYMIGMNNFFYSFKNGQLYRHNTNELRNNFYGVTSASTIKTILNDSPLDNKLFKTITLESSDAWSVDIVTNVAAQSSSITETSFEKKEGEYLAYIRTNGATAGGDLTESDFKSRANGGIGVYSESAAGGSVRDLRFEPNIELGSQISIGDSIYSGSGSTLSFRGIISDIKNGDTLATNYIRINTDGATDPSVGDFVMYFKDAQAESLGVMGHYAEVTLTLPTTVTAASELYAIESELMRSYP
jgi:hypothetical protein